MSTSDSSQTSAHDDMLRLAALLAHQLKSPISAAGSLLNAVMGEYVGSLTSDQKRALQRISARLEESLSTMRRILDIVNPGDVERAGQAITTVATCLEAFGVTLRQKASARHIELTIDSGDVSTHIRMPASAFVEVIDALVDNALKYTPDDGRIRIDTGPADNPGFLRVAVHDSGIGIPCEDRARIFEPFYRAQTAQESGRPGVGLGLSFVSAVVRKAGGGIWADRSDLGGACLAMDLPLVPEEELPRGEDGEGADRFHVLIIGGVTAGPKAAAKINRLRPDATVTVVEQGRFLSYAGCALPQYVSGTMKWQRELMSTPAGAVRDSVFFRKVKNVEVHSSTEALQIDRVLHRVKVRNSVSGKEAWLRYDRLLLATGALPVIPSIPGIRKRGVYTLHGVQDAEGIRADLAEGRARDVVIIGGGLVGVEMTETLASRGCRVTIVEREPQILRILDWEMARLVERHMEANGVRVMISTKVLHVEGRADDDGTVARVHTDRDVLPADMVILSVGVQPNVELAREAGLAIGEQTGAIEVDDHLQTSDPDIYAAGDCVECRHVLTGRPCYIPLGSTANKQGRVAAINMCGRDQTFPGVLGSTVCKVFDYCVARTGLTELEARELGYDVVTALLPAPDKAHYVPTAEWLFMKIVVDRKTSRLLGVQATGPGDGAKRADVAAMAIAAGKTVHDLGNADLCYSPHYSPLIDNLSAAANVAQNKLNGDMIGITAKELRDWLRTGMDFVLLDVRTPAEHEQEQLPQSVLVPLASLRTRLRELARGKPIVTYGNISLRAYEGALILRAAGFKDVRVLEGGLAMWPYDRD